MSGGQLMAVLIVFMVMLASVLRARYGVGRGRHGNESSTQRDDGEEKRLRDELAQLKDRMAVLERITVEKENSLAREIEQLRDRPVN